MAMPVGAKRAAGQAAAWAVAISCTVVSLIYFTQIKDIARAMVGLPKISDPHRAGDVPVAGGERRSGARAQAGNTVELRAGSYGHYHADAEINGRRIEVMIDTGASQVALSFEDAARAGIYVRDSDFTQAVRTANGIARVAPSFSTASASATSRFATYRRPSASAACWGRPCSACPSSNGSRASTCAAISSSFRSDHVPATASQPLIRHGPFVTQPEPVP
jgi:aspartyl protease family protein